MAYKIPNSSIILYTNMPMTSDYEHTIWFDSYSEQNSWFLDNTKQIYRSGGTLSYVRPLSGVVQVDPSANEISTIYSRTFSGIKHANYIRIDNPSFDDRAIYAFVDSIEYVNNNNVNINFTIDAIQTYMFSVRIYDSFVERMHNQTDNVGDNLIEEKVSTGTDMVVVEDGVVKSLQPNKIAFLSSKCVQNFGSHDDTLPQDVVVSPFSSINKYASRLGIYTVLNTGTKRQLTTLSTTLMDFFTTINDQDIVSVFQYPSILDDIIVVNAGQEISRISGKGNVLSLAEVEPIANNPSKEVYSEEITLNIKNESLGTYVPKNKKLLTYPYKYFEISNNSSNSQEFKFELFNSEDKKITFYLLGAFLPQPQFVLFPKNYGGESYIDEYSGRTKYTYQSGYELAIPMVNFPQVPFANDMYKAYLLQTEGSRAINICKSIMKLALMAYGAGSAASNVTAVRNAGGQFTGQYIGGSGKVYSNMMPYQAGRAEASNFIQNSGAVQSSFNSISQMIGEMHNAKGIANNVTGGFNDDGIKVGASRYRYEYLVYAIKPEYAKIIDDYFSMYGYAQKQIMPVVSPSSNNVNVKGHRRKVWNYVKTSGCNVRGYDEQSLSFRGVDNESLRTIKQIYDNGITFWDKNSTVQDYTQDNKLWNEV